MDILFYFFLTYFLFDMTPEQKEFQAKYERLREIFKNNPALNKDLDASTVAVLQKAKTHYQKLQASENPSDGMVQKVAYMAPPPIKRAKFIDAIQDAVNKVLLKSLEGLQSDEPLNIPTLLSKIESKFSPSCPIALEIKAMFIETTKASKGFTAGGYAKICANKLPAMVTKKNLAEHYAKHKAKYKADVVEEEINGIKILILVNADYIKNSIPIDSAFITESISIPEDKFILQVGAFVNEFRNTLSAHQTDTFPVSKAQIEAAFGIYLAGDKGNEVFGDLRNYDKPLGGNQTYLISDFYYWVDLTIKQKYSLEALRLKFATCKNCNFVVDLKSGKDMAAMILVHKNTSNNQYAEYLKNWEGESQKILSSTNVSDSLIQIAPLKQAILLQAAYFGKSQPLLATIANNWIAALGADTAKKDSLVLADLQKVLSESVDLDKKNRVSKQLDLFEQGKKIASIDTLSNKISNYSLSNLENSYVAALNEWLKNCNNLIQTIAMDTFLIDDQLKANLSFLFERKLGGTDILNSFGAALVKNLANGEMPKLQLSALWNKQISKLADTTEQKSLFQKVFANTKENIGNYVAAFPVALPSAESLQKTFEAAKVPVKVESANGAVSEVFVLKFLDDSNNAITLLLNAEFDWGNPVEVDGKKYSFLVLNEAKTKISFEGSEGGLPFGVSELAISKTTNIKTPKTRADIQSGSIDAEMMLSFPTIEKGIANAKVESTAASATGSALSSLSSVVPILFAQSIATATVAPIVGWGVSSVLLAAAGGAASLAAIGNYLASTPDTTETSDTKVPASPTVKVRFVFVYESKYISDEYVGIQGTTEMSTESYSAKGAAAQKLFTTQTIRKGSKVLKNSR